MAIARALANDPEVIVADEPTGNLDSATAAGVLEVFKDLVAAGKTIIVATHDEEIACFGTKIVEISDGRIIEVRNNGALHNVRGRLGENFCALAERYLRRFGRIKPALRWLCFRWPSVSPQWG